MGFMFFPIYFDILDESDMFYKYDFAYERDSVYRVFEVNWYFNTVYGI